MGDNLFKGLPPPSAPPPLPHAEQQRQSSITTAAAAKESLPNPPPPALKSALKRTKPPESLPQGATLSQKLETNETLRVL